MATAAQIQLAHRTIARTELSDADVEAILATGITFAAYVVELSREFSLTTGAAVAVSQVVTGLVPSSERLDILKSEAEMQLIWYREHAVMNPSLGPFEALGRGYTNEQGTGFADKYGALSTVDFINLVYVEVFGRLPSAGAMANLTSQIAFFNTLYTNEGLDNVALQAKGAVLGQIVGYAFADPSAASMTRLDDAVADFFADLANGDSSGYGQALPVPPALVFTSANTATIAENSAAATIVCKSQTNESGPLKYSLAGADAALFRLDEDTGELRFRASPDYEAPADLNGDNAYLVDITATDARGNASTRSVAIDVTDVAGIERVSVSSNGVQANGTSEFATISPDGRFVIFSSTASNLVSGDTNGKKDIFVHDRETGTTRRISVASDGTEANGDSNKPVISADGRYAAFNSTATNLVAGDNHSNNDVFLVELATGIVKRVSVAPDGAENNAENGSAFISNNGRYLTFISSATDLHPDDTDARESIFRLDIPTGALTYVGPALGSVAFENMIIYAPVTEDGQKIAFESGQLLVPGDTHGHHNIFLRDLGAGTTLISRTSSGDYTTDASSYNPSMSADGRYIAFQSAGASFAATPDTNDVTDVFLHDTATNTTTRITERSASAESLEPKVSSDGRYVVFSSESPDLVPGDTNSTHDIFVYELASGQITRVNLAHDGAQGAADAWAASISANGRFITFYSADPTLVPEDTNGSSDIFVVDGLEQGWWFA